MPVPCVSAAGSCYCCRSSGNYSNHCSHPATYVGSGTNSTDCGRRYSSCAACPGWAHVGEVGALCTIRHRTWEEDDDDDEPYVCFLPGELCCGPLAAVSAGLGFPVVVAVLMCNCFPAPRSGGGEPSVWSLRVFFAVFLAGPVLAPAVLGCFHFTAFYLLLIWGVPVRRSTQFS